MSSQNQSGGKVLIRAASRPGTVVDLLRSAQVQELLAGRVDVVEITRAKTYVGNATIRAGERLIRLSAFHGLADDEMVFIICHELAHHEVGLKQQHSDSWREACAELAQEAGQRGLLSKRRVKQAVTLALHHPATKFRGWPKSARKLEEKRATAQERNRAMLVEAGLKVGGRVSFRYRGQSWRGEVIRINRATVSVGEQGCKQTLLRVPFERITTIFTG